MNVVDNLLFCANLKPVVVNTDIKVRILVIGPKEAEALLASNSDNRALRNGRVKYYAKTMANGGWKLTHQGIAFSKSGKGIDLQHRLRAIILSGATVQIMVVEGLEDDAFEAIDQHERRTAYDALKIPKGLSEEEKFFLTLIGGSINANPTLSEIGEMAEDIRNESDMLVDYCNTRRAIYASVAMRCAAILLMLEKPKNSHEIGNSYRDLVLQKTEVWTSAMHAFGRQASAGKLSSVGYQGRVDLFCRGLIAIDPYSENMKRIQITDGITSARARIQKCFNR